LHESLGWKVDAYPEEIPVETFWGNVDYHKPSREIRVLNPLRFTFHSIL